MSLEALVANRQRQSGGLRSGYDRRVVMAWGFQMPEAVRSLSGLHGGHMKHLNLSLK
jgi:hypothetical protein